jgi:galactokinase
VTETRTNPGTEAGPSPRRRVRVPYRLSPIGAHTDHQLGLCTGFTLDRGVELLYARVPGGVVDLESRGYPGRAVFELSGRDSARPAWSGCVRGLVRVAQGRLGLRTGLRGSIAGELPPGGIASSAAVQVAVLLALLDVEDRRLGAREAARLVVEAERTESGVQVGLLDPWVILEGDGDELLVLDPRRDRMTRHRWHRRSPPREWVLVDSGERRELRESPYNQRVAECREAARRLGVAADPPALADARWPDLLRLRASLPEAPRRRAEHVFAEVKRVRQAVDAMARGDVRAFGRLMTASGESLERLFDAGTEATTRLLGLLRERPGVFGASFAGGGFGGHLQALVEPGRGASLRDEVLPGYAGAFPAEASRLALTVVSPGPGPKVGDA